MRFLAMLWAAVGVVTAGLAACSSGEREEVKVDAMALKAELQAIGQARILFAHQSVGRDILAGVQALAQEAGVPLHIQQIDGVPPAGPGLFHAQVGSNGDPDSKVEAYAGLLARTERPAYDVAVLKFCYEDLERGAKGQTGLLHRYAARMDELKSLRPDVRLVHVSVPLRADPPGWKTTLKRWLGRETWEDADNVRRNHYNDELRSRFGGSHFFDLATIQSTLPDGARSGFTHDGKTVYTLAQPYTHDGGHLNELGRRQAAAAFVHTLALALPGKR